VARAEGAPVPLHHEGTAMMFASIRVITSDVTRLAGFYAEITGLPPLRPTTSSPSYVAVQRQHRLLRLDEGAAGVAAHGHAHFLADPCLQLHRFLVDHRAVVELGSVRWYVDVENGALYVADVGGQSF
jgi:catechol-2,3-dioxygenase